jgi:hypothetical protein
MPNAVVLCNFEVVLGGQAPFHGGATTVFVHVALHGVEDW